MSYFDLILTFVLDSVKMFSTVISETHFPCDNDIYIAATDYYFRQGGIILLLSVSLSTSWIILKKSEVVSNLYPVKFLE